MNSYLGYNLLFSSGLKDLYELRWRKTIFRFNPLAPEETIRSLIQDLPLPVYGLVDWYKFFHKLIVHSVIFVYAKKLGVSSNITSQGECKCEGLAQLGV